MERDLVTGGTGLVGIYLINNLLLRGRQVRGLKRSNSDISWFNQVATELLGNDKEKLLKNLEWVDGDITDQMFVLDAVANCTRVYHTAALVSFSRRDKELLMKTNVDGTRYLIDACLVQNSRPEFCHFSSTATIGSLQGSAATELNEYVDDVASDYARSKYQAELHAFRGREEGLLVAIINPCIILGFGNWRNGPSKFFSNAKNGFPFYTEGSNAFVDVRDVSRAAVEMMDRQIFHGRFLCTAENKTYKDVFTKMALEFESKMPRLVVKPWMAEIAWRLIAIQSIFTGRALITKASTRAGLQKRGYDSSALIQAMNFSFTTIDNAIAFHVGLYKRYR